MFRIIASVQRIFSSNEYEMSLSLLTAFGLQSLLHGIRLAVPAVPSLRLPGEPEHHFPSLYSKVLLIHSVSLSFCYVNGDY